MNANKEIFEQMKPGQGPKPQTLLSYKAEDISGVLQSTGLIEANVLVKLNEDDESTIIRLAEIKLQNDPQISEEDAVASAYLDRIAHLIGSGVDYLDGLDQEAAAKLVSEMTGIKVSSEELDLFKKFAEGNESIPFTEMLRQWIKKRLQATKGVETLTAKVDGGNVVEVRH